MILKNGSRVYCRLLGVPRKLGYRVRYEEGTNLRCREDPDPEADSDDRLAFGT